MFDWIFWWKEKKVTFKAMKREIIATAGFYENEWMGEDDSRFFCEDKYYEPTQVCFSLQA